MSRMSAAIILVIACSASYSFGFFEMARISRGEADRLTLDLLCKKAKHERWVKSKTEGMTVGQLIEHLKKLPEDTVVGASPEFGEVVLKITSSTQSEGLDEPQDTQKE